MIVKPEAWFTYYYWLDDAHAPDFARTVNIHHKPGYDPVELFIDPQIKYLSLNATMDLTPLDAELIRGLHGHLPDLESDRPLFITQTDLLPTPSISAIDVCNLLLKHLLL